MLIKCPECQREVSDRAPTCPGCGAPLAAPPELRGLYPGEPGPEWRGSPSMGGSFMLGALGTLARWFGIVCVLGALLGFVFHGPAAGFWLIVGLLALGAGSYAKYVSGHSVRLTK